MDFTINLSGIENIQNPFAATWFLIQNGGWVLLVLTCIWGSWEGWKEWRRNKFNMSIPYTLLALDIPKENEQSPKAVEHIFSHLYGIYKKGTLKQRYIDGYNQMGVSFELVSIEGYIQFLIRTPTKFRDLIEAAVYAQYPDAEITEVEDYIDKVPKPLQYPNPEYDLWGTEFRFTNKNFYPIKTYPQFEHPLTQKLMDPMASLLEILSRMGPGEQLWLQLVVEPLRSEWREPGLKLIKKLIGKKEQNKKGIDWTYFPGSIARGLSESFTASIVPPTEEKMQQRKTEREWPSMMQHLSPNERSVVESVGMKISKIGFRSKIRMIYTAKKNVFNKPKGVNAIIGALEQFNTLDLNGFAPHKKSRTTVYYMFIKYRKKWRQRRILWGYRYRSIKRGWTRLILNTEELASIWHFPVREVKAPMVQKIVSKKAEPPSTLPVESVFMPTGKTSEVTRKASAPANLPIK